jgi:hypothetical protein
MALEEFAAWRNAGGLIVSDLARRAGDQEVLRQRRR